MTHAGSLALTVDSEPSSSLNPSESGILALGLVPFFVIACNVGIGVRLCMYGSYFEVSTSQFFTNFLFTFSFVRVFVCFIL